jgi:hypothetical protein
MAIGGGILFVKIEIEIEVEAVIETSSQKVLDGLTEVKYASQEGQQILNGCRGMIKS